MSTKLGVNPSLTFTGTDEAGIPFAVGQIGQTDNNGKQYVFVKTTSAIAAGDCVTYDETYNTIVAPLGTANDARGDRAGVATVAIASGSYGWLQIYGVNLGINVLASCAANARLNTTATAGSLDDDGTAGSMQVEGIYLTTARGGTNGSAPGVLNYPIIGITL
jgi:hypothetical protein